MSASSEKLAEALRVSVKESERLRQQNQRLLEAAAEPIAIVGMSCRFPGGVGSPADLWEVVSQERDAIAEFPSDRGWDLEALYDPDPDVPLSSYTRHGGFLAAPGDFDPAFFGISPRDALAIDPQQRLLLEASWEALEDAGIDPLSLRGGRAGVFAGVMYQDYGTPTELAPGMTTSAASGRVAYTLGLEGPTMTIDTACSSSLVAMHLAAQALRAGECSLALAGGVTVFATPWVLTYFSRQRGLSPDGRCKSFAEAADGAGFAEGVGVLALERLSDAERNGHTVLATIRGSAVNQDGASNGLTAPNGPSQERVIRQALANARLEPKDIDVVEAHGTGTTLGDPIEAGALLATYGQDRETPLKLGSVKSNIGHTQAAAGVAGVIKAVLSMREGVLPKTLHVDSPSSKVDWEAGEIELLTEPAEWMPNGHPRRAGVSSFGASGTNAHLILEEAPVVGRDPGPGASDKDDLGAGAEDGSGDAVATSLPGPVPLVLSAKSPEALEAQAERLVAHLKEHPNLHPTDLTFSLATTRAQMEQRAVVVGTECDELLAGLSALAKGEPAPNTHTAKATSGRLAYLFTGQGSQRAGMGKELHGTYPAYAEALDEACEAIDQHIGRSLKELIFSEPGSEEAALLDHTTYAQPALFATELALHRLFESFGLKPDLLTGHSVGEIVAAHIAGVFSLADAAKLISARGKLMGELAEGGAMLAVEATEPETFASIEGKEELLSLAAVNGPSACVISGAESAIAEVEIHWQEEGRKTKRLVVSHAFHSPLIEPILDAFAEVVGSLDLNEPSLPVISNTTGEQLTSEQATHPAYWVSHAREPVRFADAVATLKDQGATTYLELGPDAVLTAMAAGTLADEETAALIPTLRQGRDEAQAIALAFGSAHTSGAKVEWQTFFKGTGATAVPLPTYPFQRKRYWLSASSGSSDPSSIGQTSTEHPFLAATIEDPQGEGFLLTGRISLQTHPWLADHAVNGTVILPGTAFVEMALRAGQEAGCELLEELTLQAPLLLPESGGVALQVSVSAPNETGEREVSIHSRAEVTAGDESPGWTRHAEGTLSVEAPDLGEPLAEWPPAGAELLEADSAYDRFAELGLEYGPAFQGLVGAWRQGDDIYAEVSLAPEQASEAARFAIHPALLDSALHAVLLGNPGEGAVSLPFAWSGVRLSAAASALRMKIGLAGSVEASVEIADEGGRPLGKVDSLRVRPVDPRQLRQADRSGLMAIEWSECATEAPVAADEPMRVVALDELGFERSGDAAVDARNACRCVLLEVQRVLAAAEPQRLAVLTSAAVAALPGEEADPAGASVWGLLRAAQAEHPGRIVLLDSDGSDTSPEALAAAIATSAEEPQLALREGRLLAPRVVRTAPVDDADPPRFDPESTVLITGGTGGLGSLLAEHLVAAHGVRQLLLVSRRGAEADGAPELAARLEELGATVRLEARDVSERSELEALLESIDPEHRLGAVVHAAGIVEDGVIASLDAAQLDRVFAPKLDAAWHLHELTRELDLSAFILFSSLAGALGSPAQANYGAANAFLDALATRRRARGLPAISLAWGLWSREGGMGAQLDAAGLARMARSGLAPLDDEQGLVLFDAALGSEEPQLLTARFDLAALRALAAHGTIAPALRSLVPASRRRRARSGALVERLAAMPAAQRLGFALNLVRGEAAAVLGHAGAAEVDPERAFKELGFDSLAAVELRNRLGAATGLTLPATIVFDYPTAATLAGYLVSEASGEIAARPAVRVAASEEPIAIIGMSCRYPGGVDSPTRLWDLVTAGRDAISEFPTDRGWDLERLYDPDPDSVGTSYTREGGFLAGATEFDPDFFGISPHDALGTDPQQRLLLEASWEALEDAGVDPQRLRGSQTGVFAGVMYHDYGWGQGPATQGYGLTVGSGSVLSGRVSYTLGLEGPAITVDTACSSSLVAMHLAGQALRAGECTLALAGGVTVLATPRGFIEFSRQRGLSPDGRCKSFADSADGVGWSEGVGVLALERLSDAERNGHTVLATIRGSAVNQDGASNGLTAPNGPSQERVIRQALANARLEPKDVDVVEAHGTGTTLGDPIEAGALLATYGQERDQPLKLGSVKSNIGHTQAAAGVAGVIKAVLSMREGVLPKTLHVDSPSSKVDWESGEIELLTEESEWKPNGHPRRAGVSSFGASGTNAHLILEEAPVVGRDPGPGASDKDDLGVSSKDDPSGSAENGATEIRGPLHGPVPLVLSAKSPEALRDSAERLATHLEDNPESGLTDLAFSLATTRAQMEERGTVVGTEREELLAGLSALAKGEPAPNAHTAKATSGRLAYLFTGQGSQRAGMGKELYETYPAYAKALDEACEAIDQHIGRSLKELIFSEPGSKEAELLDHTTYAQPALFATELALHRLFESFGLEPDLLTGHSVGEIVAAHIAGVFSLEDVAKLISARGKLMGDLPEGGAMLAIEATEEETLASIEDKEALLSLAAVNSPRACVISGNEQAISELEAHWREQGRKTKRLVVSHAFHSPLIEPMLDSFAEVVSSLELNAPTLPVISNTTGELLTEAQATDPAYWVSHARRPVRFADAVATLKDQGAATTYLELGPDAVLTAMAAGTLADEESAALIPTLREGRDEARAIALAFGSAHASGAKVEWQTYFKGTGAKAVPLPTYPFQRKRYWLSASSGASGPSSIGLSSTEHPFLAATIEDPQGEGLLLTGRISLQTHPWLADHAVNGTVLLPGTAFVEMALRAGQEVGCELLEELTLQAPLLLPESGGVALQVSVSAPGEEGEREVSIHSRPETGPDEEPAPWTCHAEGVLSAKAREPGEPLAEWPPQGAEPLDVSSAYERLAEASFDYGPAFQGLTAAWQQGDEIYAEVSLGEGEAADAARFVIHPALLDGVFHAGLQAVLGAGDKPLLPFAWQGVRVIGGPAAALRVKLTVGEREMGLVAFSDAGESLLRIESVRARELEPGVLRQLESPSATNPLHTPTWKELLTPTEPDEGEETPTRLLRPADLDFTQGGDPAEDALAATASALTFIQQWLKEQEAEEGEERLVLLTERAVSASEGEEPDLTAASLQGLWRSAASEHLGRFAAIDTDGSDASAKALESAIALSGEEPQIAIRQGKLLAPRLVPSTGNGEETAPIDPDSTVLITGGLSGIGAQVARHLAGQGITNLLLVSRRGMEAEGAAELITELEGLGATARVEACDVSDRSQLEALFASIDQAHPLGAIVHSAGLLDDGTLESLDQERLERVFTPKANAAWHLHELSRDLELSQFLLFSSSAGLLGGAAQANYAAANAFLDALAQKRAAEGLPATSLAWGLWQQGSGALSVEIDESQHELFNERIRTRLGFSALSAEQGLALFDTARSQAEPLVAPVAFDKAALRSQAAQGTLPALLKDLIRTPAKRQGQKGSLAKRLASTPQEQRQGLVEELVRSTAAAVLGHASAAQVPPERAFKELGFDSLAAVELRNRLGAATGIRLQATVVFDYPNAKELARHLLSEAEGSQTSKVTLKAQASDEPIAIIGMSCRYPGGVSSPNELWQLLSEGRDAIGPFPSDRGWDLERLYDPDPSHSGTSYARHGGFLADVAEFDSGFFGISPRDALGSDPQQRLLLEASWEALEDAAIDPTLLQGSSTGVFAGVMYQDYGAVQHGLAPGMSGSVVSGRVAYALGLEGPTMTVDTACSSSLVSLHLASQALRGGECSLALAGGVTVLSTPWMLTFFASQRGLSPDGRCRSFAESADGVGFAEGVGVLALERLSDAERNGHTVLATIRGSAVNQDGASNGLTAPNGPSQERVIRQALANARLESKDVDVVEAHGTGTTLGDPIEAGALLATYGQDRERPLKLGSVKSNIGHTQAAAGVAGVIKAVLAMREGVLPKTLHVDAPSSKVEWESGEIELLTEESEWKPNGYPRRAGVSSFGASGTNAHLILEEAPVVGRDPGPGASDKDDLGTATEDGPGETPTSGPSGLVPLILSAKSPEALRDSAERLAAHLKNNPELDLIDASFSLATTRAQMEERAVVVGAERDGLLAGLSALAQGEPAPNTHTAKATSGRLAYLFAGQGSQRPGMGKELYETHPAYAKALDQACEAIDQHIGRSLKELIFSEPGSEEAALLDHTTYAQPALFATELALHRLFESFGLTPDLLTGHSVGEIVAAHIGGVFSLSDAAKLISARGKLMGELPEGGAMLAIEATEAETLTSIEGQEQELSLAAVNGPKACVISGAESAIAEVESYWQKQGRKTKRLQVSHAFHSPLIEPMLEAFAEVVSSLELNAPTLPVISNTTGEQLTTEQATDPAYWVSHARQPVRFADAITTLEGQGATTYLELGPDAVLTAMAAGTLAEDEAAALIPTLREGRDEARAVALAFGSAHATGVKVNWETFFKGTGAKAISLPTYPFQRKRYWVPTGLGAGDLGAAGLGETGHPLLSAVVEDPAGDELTLTGRISLQAHPWLTDHSAAGTVILPGTAFVEMALRAGQEAGCGLLEELTLQAPLLLPESGGVALQVSVSAPGEDGGREVSIHSRPESGADEEPAPWTHHAEGVLSAEAPDPGEPLAEWPPAGAEPVELDSVYDRLAQAGLEYGPAFQGLTAAWQQGNETYAEVSLAPEQAPESSRFGVHPALLDSALHGALDQIMAGREGRPLLPFAWGGIHVEGPGASTLRVKLALGEESFSLEAFDPTGDPLLSVGSVIGREVDPEALHRPSATNPLHTPTWKELDAPTEEGEGEEGPTRLLRPADLDFTQGDDPAEDALAATASALSFIQQWLKEQEAEEGEERLVLLTERAVPASEGEEPSLTTASLQGLWRSAASEHPGRFAAIDTDGEETSEEALESALALSGTEPQLALREGKLLAPRLVPSTGDSEEAAPIDPDSTVLITGGLSGIGAQVARHLAGQGITNLLLVSRRGMEAEGARELVAELGEELGAKARVEACDVSDRSQLEALFESIDQAHPLGAIVHSAGLLDDGVIESLDGERLARVFTPKANAAWHLHELSKDLELSQLLLFSSSAGLLGGAAQANYAAANAFLDALAQKRAAEGLPATSLAWGLWQQGSGALSVEIDESQHELLGERIRTRLGFSALSAEQGLALFDAARSQAEPLVAPVAFDKAALRSQAAQGTLPALLKDLIHTPAKRQGAQGSLAVRLASTPQEQRQGLVEELVRSTAAAVLGHASATQVPPERAFKELGFDSLAAVELRNRLGAATGIRLQATVVFDYPNAKELARYLLSEAEGGQSFKVTLKAQASDEPIAIIGMSCRYPGGVSSPNELWQLLSEGRDAIGPFPSDRGWDLERLYDPDPSHSGTSYARHGGFLADVAEFDSGFFGISPNEATATDPQQRLLLEAAWEALEDAGVDPGRLRETPAGVFAGVMYGDYASGVTPPPQLEGYLATGGSASVLSGRVAYVLGLEGPAITVDTACSSSLVTLHLAAQALRAGECSLALAGGVTVLATPRGFIEFSRQRGLSPDGRCKSFSESADGVGWSEGVGVLALERLSDAERNGHTVLATIRGSAVNQDGASNGLTAPNGPSQERVIRQALANARLEPKDVDVVEAHGTGTTLGDPIEAGALLATYGQERDAPLKLGSVKSNLGHTQAAAGVAGVIKAVLSMREGVLPKTLHVDSPSSKVDWEAGEIELLTEPAEWKPNGRTRRAAVSSFGISGTNAHLILEEAPALSMGAPQGVEGTGVSSEDRSGEEGERSVSLAGPVPLVLSAKSPEALRDSAERLAAHLKDNPGLDLIDASFSLATTRAQMEERAVVVGAERDELLAGLSALSSGEPAPNAHTAKSNSGRLAYLFTGQGSQRAGMGKELYETYPAYAQALDEACEAIDPHIDHSLKELIFSEPGSEEAERLDHTTYAQPALFATELALHRLFESFGLKPDLLTGHSVGEIVAAHIAGVFSLADAAKLISARGKLMGDLPTGGAMLAVEATEEETLASIEGREDLLSLAAVNGPNACVISGDEKAIDQLESHWREQDRKTKRLVVSHAFHSPLIEPMLEPFAEVVGSLDLNASTLPVISNTTGQQLTEAQATDPAYWVSHARQPVRFADAVATLKDQGATTYLELGPDPVLTAMAAGILADEESAALIPTLREGRDEAQTIALAFGSAHASGAEVEWQTFFKGTGATAVPLPTYPFQRKRYWLSASSGSSDPSSIGQTSTEHPFLAATIEDPQGEGLLLTGRISLPTHPWLADHAVNGTVILPGTAFVEMALRAGEEAGCELLEELTLQAPLLLPESGGVALQVSVSASGEEGEREVSIHSRPETGSDEEPASWTRHAEGVLSTEAPEPGEPLAEWPPLGAEPLEVDSAYDRFAELGLEYGPAFQGLVGAWRQGDDIYAEVSLAPEQASEAARFAIHPALLDAIAHTGLLGPFDPGDDTSEGVPFPVAWSGVAQAGVGHDELRVKITAGGEQEASFQIADSSGAPVATIERLRARPVPLDRFQAPEGSASKLAQALHTPTWKELPAPTEPGEHSSTPTRLLRPADLDFLQSDDPAEDALAATASALSFIQQWLKEQESEDTQERLVLLTEGAASTGEEEKPNLTTASLWGLWRSAASEHPGRFAAIDTDETQASQEAIESAIALSSEEPQIVLREGKPLAPRLIPSVQEEETAPINPNSTVLITGGLSGIGARVARHLAGQGITNLLLVSRRGMDSEGAAELLTELQELGAKARVEACDVSDRSQLEALFESIDQAHPLGAIVHSAGLLDDGVIESLDGERLARVFTPKAAAAWHLHELSRDLQLSQFLLFSSSAGLLGGAAQANYAAANAFLDALAQRRQAEGLPATSLAWGLWQQGSGALSIEIDESQHELFNERIRTRLGFSALSTEQGLALFDAARSQAEPLVAPVVFDKAALRSQATQGTLPALLKDLVRISARRQGQKESLAKRLASTPEEQRQGLVLELVHTHTAAVLGHSSAAQVDPERAFKDLGFDSLAAVELRNRLGAATGIPLPATVVFDYPSVTALADYVLEQVAPAGESRAVLESGELEVREALASLPLARLRAAGLLDPLLRLADPEANSDPEPEEDGDRIDTMDVEELLRASEEQAQ